MVPVLGCLQASIHDCESLSPLVCVVAVHHEMSLSPLGVLDNVNVVLQYKHTSASVNITAMLLYTPRDAILYFLDLKVRRCIC